MGTENQGLKIYVPPAQVERLREIAKAEDRTVTGLIRLAITAYLAERDAQQVAA